MPIETTDSTKQLYSQRSIGIATFFGGPLAAGILVQRNYINLGNEGHGKQALYLGILLTIALFLGIFSIPEELIDKIPNSVFPAIYTALIYLAVEKLQGKQLNAHKDNNGSFYSAWNATGIGFGCMVVLLAGIFGYAYFFTADFDSTKYNKGLAEVQQFEAEALQLFSMNGTPEEAVNFIDTRGIPNWEKCIATLNEMNSIEGLTNEFKEQNQILLEYCQLRIEAYQLIKKANLEATNKYDSEIELLDKKINDLLARL
jgi:4-amino-4-deoxy-L-arabinose transferase-like glycosyltransferase